MNYHYFISYFYSNGANSLGFGSCEIVTKHKIRSLENLTKLVEALKNTNNFAICICLNYKLLRKSLFKFRK